MEGNLEDLTVVLWNINFGFLEILGVERSLQEQKKCMWWLVNFVLMHKEHTHDEIDCPFCQSGQEMIYEKILKAISTTEERFIYKCFKRGLV
jgi:hypothetical protein